MYLGVVNTLLPLSNDDSILVLWNIKLVIPFSAGKHCCHAEAPADGLVLGEEGGLILGEQRPDEECHPPLATSHSEMLMIQEISYHMKTQYHTCVCCNHSLFCSEVV